MTAKSDLELSENKTASNGQLKLDANEPFTPNTSVQRLHEEPTESSNIEPEYATGFRLTVIIATICFSTFLTALDLVSALTCRLARSTPY
jgi:hypothetical protein